MSGSESEHEVIQKSNSEFPKQGEDLRGLFGQDFSTNTNESISGKPEMGSTSPSFSSKNIPPKSAAFGESGTQPASAKSERGIHTYACPADCDCGKYGSPKSGKDRQSSPNPNRKLRIEESFNNLGEHARESSEKKYLRFSEYVLRKISVRVIRAAQKGLWRTEVFLTETSWSRDLENQRRLVESLAKQKLLAHVYPAHNRKIRISVKWSPDAQSNLECSLESASTESESHREEHGDQRQHRHLRRHRASSPSGSESESEIEDDSEEASAIETDFERQEKIARKARRHARRLEKLELIKVREQEEKEKRKALQKLKAKYSQELSGESSVSSADEAKEDKKYKKGKKKDKKNKKDKKGKKGKKEKKDKKKKKSSSESEVSLSSDSEEELSLFEATNKRDTERVSKLSGEEGSDKKAYEGGEKREHHGHRRGPHHGKHHRLSGSDLDLDIWFGGNKGSRSSGGRKEMRVVHEMSSLLEGAERGICRRGGGRCESSSRRRCPRKLEGYGDLIESFGGRRRKRFGKAREHSKRGKGFTFVSDSDTSSSSSSSSSSSDSD